MLKYNKYLTSCIFGLISGFNLMISGSTINFWLSKENVDIVIIGYFSLISLPYAISFLYAPIFDSIYLCSKKHQIENRILWLNLLLAFLCLSAFAISYINPEDDIIAFALCSFLIASFASSADTIIGALRADISEQENHGVLSGYYVFGYRIGMIISGYGAIYMSSYIDFSHIYQIFAAIIFFFILLIVIISYKKHHKPIAEPTARDLDRTNYKKISSNILLRALTEVGQTKYLLILFFFLLTYRLPDNFINVMLNPFLLDVGYSSSQIANAGKLVGVIFSIVGGLVASVLMKNLSLVRSLFVFGFFHAFAHLTYLLIYHLGANIYILVLASCCEGLTGGLTMAAYIGFITSLCQGQYKATQYAIFSSIMGLSRSLFSAISGYFVIFCGWDLFFLFVAILALLPLILLNSISKIYNNQKSQNKI